MRALGAGALVVLVLASCGGGDDNQSSADPCSNHPPGFTPARRVLPGNVVPAGTLVGAVRREGRTVSGSTFFPFTLEDAYANLKAGGANAGYQLATDDYEGFEAEVGLVRVSGEQLFFKLTQIQGCSSVTAGTFARKRPS